MIVKVEPFFQNTDNGDEMEDHPPPPLTPHLPMYMTNGTDEDAVMEVDLEADENNETMGKIVEVSFFKLVNAYLLLFS